MLLAEPDRFSPDGLLRNLGADSDRGAIAELAQKLPDGDAALAEALRGAPTVLGFVLEPAAGQAPPGVPMLARGRIRVPDIWRAGGAIGPLPAIAEAGRGFGAIALAADADGEVRRVPLLVVTADQVRPGFAVEVLRVGYDASSFILDTAPQRLHIGLEWWRRSMPTRLCEFCSAPLLLGSTGRCRPGKSSPTTERARRLPVASCSSAAARRRWEGQATPVFPDDTLGADPGRRHRDARDAIGRRPACPASRNDRSGRARHHCHCARHILPRCRRDGLRGLVVLVVDYRRLRLPLRAFLGRHGRAAGNRHRRFRRHRIVGYARNAGARALRRRFEQHLAPDVVKRLVDAPGRASPRRRDAASDGDVHRRRRLHRADRAIRRP